MTESDLSRVYRAYIDCLNRQDWTNLGKFVHDEVSHNGQRVGGKRISFTENMFYEFREGRIVQVWSVIDKAAIEAQL